jgi:hypothetical protein
MAEQGYELADTLDDNVSKYAPSVKSYEPSQEEIDMALWDVQCQERTGVVQTWLEVESAYQEEKIDEQAEAFAAIKAENELILKRAAEALERLG